MNPHLEREWLTTNGFAATFVASSEVFDGSAPHVRRLHRTSLERSEVLRCWIKTES
jgi:hypothetical protein